MSVDSDLRLVMILSDSDATITGSNIAISSPFDKDYFDSDGHFKDVISASMPNNRGCYLLNKSDIPESVIDGMFFQSWTYSEDSGFSTDIPKARIITKEKLRVDRKPLLEVEDVKFQRALETGADTTDIVAEKQRLRDITNDVDTMTTRDQLKTKIMELDSG